MENRIINIDARDLDKKCVTQHSEAYGKYAAAIVINVQLAALNQ